MSDSDDDIGPGGSYYRSYRYMMSPEFTTFLGWIHDIGSMHDIWYVWS